MILSSTTGFIHIMITILCVIASISIYSCWKKDRNEMFKNFMMMFVFVGIFMFTLGVTDYLLLNDSLMANSPGLPGYLFAFAHIFIILAIAFYVKIPFGILKPGKENIGFTSALGLGAISIIVAFLNPASLSVEDRVTHYSVPVAFTATIGIWALIFITGLGTGFFIYQGFKLKDRFLKIRSFTLGLGFLLWSIGGPMHDIAETRELYVIANSLLLFSFGIIFLALYMNRFVSTNSCD